MWQAIEAEMEKEREQAEALALIERKKAEMRARAQPPAAGIMQNALATLDAPTEGEEFNQRFKPKISEIQNILVDENIEQEEIDDSDVLLAPDLVEVRQDEGPSNPEITDELLETQSLEAADENDQSNDERVNEEPDTSDTEETDSADTQSQELVSEDEDEIDWNNVPAGEDGWAVGW